MRMRSRWMSAHGQELSLTEFHSELEANTAIRLMEALYVSGFGEDSRYRVPRPLAFTPDRRMVVTAQPDGVMLRKLLDRRAPETLIAVQEAGRWLARLHATEVRIGSGWFPWKSLSGLSNDLARVPANSTTPRTDLRHMLHALAPLAPRAGTRHWVQTHGLFRPDRVHCGVGMTTVTDFVRAAPGDPARDVAEFIVHLRLRAARSGDPRAESLLRTFLEGYLRGAPEEHLVNLPFYGGCSALTSLAGLLARGSSSDGLREATELHLDVFHRHLGQKEIALKAPA
jgi:hypothetical protein